MVDTKAQTFHFELVSPEQKLMSEPVHMVVVPGEEGDFGVLSQHSALVSSIRAGVLEIYANDNDTNPRKIFVAGGFADVTPNSLTVLAEEANMVSDLDKTAIEKQISEWQQDLSIAEDPAKKLLIKQKIETAEAKVFAIK